jgi:hypothetical protein
LSTRAERINLADPSFEPSDEQLIGLAARAFAGVEERHKQALAKLRAEIAAAREQSLRALDARARSRASQ